MDLLTVSKFKTADYVVRWYAMACASHYGGELGQLRIRKAREETTNYIKTDMLSCTKRSSAQAVAEETVECELVCHL
ncbi:hypothetical protein KI688_012957 [Linnemannia hyalina]|uniref:Uncharacterized protein n=1 Tax=Linnemannia hyalina TaxID=64524 RepID=A0A9P8BSZ4_9FUNG|nr:hypothetical protein KI688_012957 [Linnemannia hyalina]